MFTGAPLVVPPFRGTSGGSGISSGGGSGGERVLKMRKPIQICNVQNYEVAADIGCKEEVFVPDSGIMALCDDGSVWTSWFSDPQFKWHRLPNIPQDDENGTT